MVSLNSIKAKARDTRRRADLYQITIALEMYFDTYGGYPSSAWPNVDYKIINSLALETKIDAFIKPMPRDPRGLGTCYNNEYLYVSNIYNDGSSNNAKATMYVLYATLENQTFNNLSTVGVDAWLRGGNGSCGSSGLPNYRVESYN